MQLENLDRALRPELDAHVYRSLGPRPRQYPGNARFRSSSRDDVGETLRNGRRKARPESSSDATRTDFRSHDHDAKP